VSSGGYISVPLSSGNINYKGLCFGMILHCRVLYSGMIKWWILCIGSCCTPLYFINHSQQEEKSEW